MIILFGKNKLDVIFQARWSPDDIIASPFPLNRLYNRAKVFMEKYIQRFHQISSKLLVFEMKKTTSPAKFKRF